MKYISIFGIGILFFISTPFLAQAAMTISGGQNLVFTKSTPALNNVYIAGGTVIVATSTPQDLTILGGSVILSAPVRKDVLAAAGSIEVRAPVGGNLRAVGARVSITAPVTGDLAVMGFSVDDNAAHAKDILAIGDTVRLLSGSRGQVTVYGNNIYLSGTFNGDVHAQALNTLTLAPNTIIHGSLKYEASEAATIPSSAHVDGIVTYTGASFLPTSQEAAAFALAGIGIFFLVRIIGAVIVAGLFAGLFAAFTNKVTRQVTHKPFPHTMLMLLLGFGIITATPVLLLLLSITFVGLVAAFIIATAYMFLLLIAFVYAGIISGAILRNRFTKRNIYVTWKDAVLGMFVLMLIGIVPVFGMLAIGLLTCLATGVIGSIFYRFAFTKRNINNI